MKYLPILGIVILIVGCSFNQMGKSLGEGLVAGAATGADSLGAGVVKGARDALTDSVTKHRLSELIDQLGDTLTHEVTAMRDTLLGRYTQLWIRQLKNDLLGDSTRMQLATLRNELLGDRTRMLVRDLSNELLGAATRSAIDSIITSSVMTLALGYEKEIKPKLQEQESIIKKYASELAWGSGGLIASLMILGGVIFARSRRYRKMVEVMTFQIHEIPDQQFYDELTRRIRKKAQEVGVERHLRKVLSEQGILGKESWRP